MIVSAMIRALLGRRRWLKVKRKYDVDNKGAYVIMMPDADIELNQAALRHIDDFLSYRKGNSVVVLTTDAWTEQNASGYSKRIAAVERIARKDYIYYNNYYNYYGFSERFIMMSLQGGYGERLALAHGVNGITKEDLVCLGLYLIRNWKSAEELYGQL